MQDYKEQKMIKNIANTLRILADLMENNPIIAREVLKELGAQPAVPPAPVSSKVGGVTLEKSSLPDVFAIFMEKGAVSLQEELQLYEVQILKQIVSNSHLDTAGKVRRWRSKERIINFIIDAVDKRVSQGDAFRSGE
jgi:hypothetical protein